ncbi:unnamed protein product (macronuclear) [Paramecium tetraurelia]|uniref:Transmembrane protein n=1 Tax=Paramecium tetraurelia TaxID=5888 RepID=A0DQV8_PARTE|nr:uncharacterized protein GSPATT00002825001 [Paramecium tetraurelia]CAK85425.1 unnamed protein product [Paramecium tetraurelia]|eukprot:XP_001452822.1 hypothetical protein (macronuclear) [Paramecium tetraurelia strain d4-2]
MSLSLICIKLSLSFTFYNKYIHKYFSVQIQVLQNIIITSQKSIRQAFKVLNMFRTNLIIFIVIMKKIMPKFYLKGNMIIFDIRNTQISIIQIYQYSNLFFIKIHFGNFQTLKLFELIQRNLITFEYVYSFWFYLLTISLRNLIIQ